CSRSQPRLGAGARRRREVAGVKAHSRPLHYAIWLKLSCKISNVLTTANSISKKGRFMPARSFLLFIALILLPLPVLAQESCFTAEGREQAERTAKVVREPDPGYDPVLGYNPQKGPRRGAPPVDANGLANPINCVANRDPRPGSG